MKIEKDGKVLFRCKHCGEEFLNKWDYASHYNSCKYNPINNLDINCPFCNKHFNRKAQYNRHIKYCDKNPNKKNTKTKIENDKKKEKFLTNWLNEKHKCKNCGKIMDTFFGSGEFCSRKCANTHKLSKETKNKISNSLKNNISSGKNLNSVYHTHTEEEVKIKLIEKLLNIFNFLAKQPECEICHKKLTLKQYKRGNKTCSRECSSILGGKTNKQRLQESHTSGWKPHGTKYYSEIFWKNILDKHNISYIEQYYINKKSLGLSKGTWYYLDFYIEKDNLKIDLEIDGEQHHKDKQRELHDRERDNLLIKNGFIVYRIDWTSPYNDNNKQILGKQINDFLQWYNNL